MPDFFDTTEVRKLASDLGRVPAKSVPAIEAVTKKGALNIKQGWARRWEGHAHAPRLPSTISFDMKYGLGSIGAEIGPTKGGPGSLGNIYEFGTPKNAPMPAGMPALTEEEPRFEQGIIKALTEIMEA